MCECFVLSDYNYRSFEPFVCLYLSSGLTYIHLLTSRGHWSLRVDLQDFNGTSAYAIYDRFSVSGPEDNYTLTIGGYSGTAGMPDTSFCI